MKAPNRTFINFKKQIPKFTEEQFSRATLNSNVHESESIFRKIINMAA